MSASDDMTLVSLAKPTFYFTPEEKPKTREQLLLEFDNDEDDETEEILDQSDNEEDITIIETEFDELCGEEELDNEIANLDNDLHVYKKKLVC